MNDLAVHIPAVAFSIPSQVILALVIIGGIGVFAWLRSLWRSAQTASSPAKPSPDKPSVDVIANIPPAPRLLKLNFLRPNYDFGERIPLNPGGEAHGDDENCSALSNGIVDNGTGPYDAKMRAYVTKTGQEMPIYDEETGEDVSNKWVKTEQSPNGKWGWKRLAMYALGRRPYDRIGSLVNCDVFVPLPITGVDAAAVDNSPKACGSAPCPTSSGPQTVNVAQVVGITVECMVRNQYGAVSGPSRQEILAATSPCGGTKDEGGDV